MNRNIIFIALLVSLITVSCSTPPPPSTGLYEKGTHTGTLTLLRVEDNWVPDEPIQMGPHGKVVGWKPGTEERCTTRLANNSCDEKNPQRRFVPLRHKDEIANLSVTEDDIVDDSENITLTLNNAFIRYFSEENSTPNNLFENFDGGGQSPQGEIAMILSFDSGESIKQSYLVYASQGQTFGSFLDFQDWVVAGPVRITASSLSIRMVLIEMDQAENEKVKDFVKGIAQIAPVVSPGISRAVPIASPIAETIIAQNGDDVVFDQRFTLKRMIQGEKVRRGALLYGKYVAVSQEDFLAENDARDRAASSIIPTNSQRLRYDLASDRLFKVYNYWPTDYAVGQKRNPKTGRIETVRRPVDMRNNWGPQNVSEPQALSFVRGQDCHFSPSYNSLINGDIALYRRQNVLGFKRDGKLHVTNTNCTRSEAFGRIAWESARLTSKRNRNQRNLLNSVTPRQFDSDGNYIFSFPVLDYPQAYTLAAQYAQHTHFVFTIEESVGHAGQKYHERFPEYSNFLETEIQQSKDTAQLQELGNKLTVSIISQKKVDSTMKWLRANTDAPKEAQLCKLYNTLEKLDSDAAGANSYLFNKISGIAGTYFSSTQEIFNYMKSEYKDNLNSNFSNSQSGDAAIGLCALR